MSNEIKNEECPKCEKLLWLIQKNAETANLLSDWKLFLDAVWLLQGRNLNVSVEERNMIQTLHNSGYSLEDLAFIFSRSKSTVSENLKKPVDREKLNVKTSLEQTNEL